MAVICPLAASHLHSLEPCESYAKSQKTDRYAPAFVKSDYDFAPVVLKKRGKVLKQIIRFASIEPGLVYPVVFSTLPLSRF